MSDDQGCDDEDLAQETIMVRTIAEALVDETIIICNEMKLLSICVVAAIGTAAVLASRKLACKDHKIEALESARKFIDTMFEREIERAKNTEPKLH